MRQRPLYLYQSLLLSIIALVTSMQSAHATLIDDDVTCRFSLVTIVSISGPCSQSRSQFVPGPATVTDEGFTDPEFYIAANVPILPGQPFLSIAAIDVAADFFELRFDTSLSGLSGYLSIWMSSLDWTIPISETVLLSNFQDTEVTAGALPTAVFLQARTDTVPQDAFIRAALCPHRLSFG